MLRMIITDLTDCELRKKCEDAGINVAMITSVTRNLFIKKLQNIGNETSQVQNGIFEKEFDDFAQPEIQEMNPAKLRLIMQECHIPLPNDPITENNR